MLSETKVKAAKPRPKPYKLSDGGSLFLLVTPSGGKLWRWNYLYDGKQKSMAFGAWPHVSIGDARGKRDEAYSVLAEGRDPSIVKRLKIEAVIEASRQTFERVAREWHANAKPQWTAIHAADVIRSLERDVFPTIGDLPIADLTPPLILGVLRETDRRAFAWEWLRRSSFYRRLWARRTATTSDVLADTGLLASVDPALAAPDARPIWSIERDPHVLGGRPAPGDSVPDDLFDVRSAAPFVSVAVDASHREHWLLSDGCWAIRLDLHDGTLLGGPILVEHRITGLVAARPKLEALRQFVMLAQRGDLPASMMPRERKAAQWILELRAGDALPDAANQQEMARALFGPSIARRRWRLESASYRLRVQRLAKAARRRLAEPLVGPWFD